MWGGEILYTLKTYDRLVFNSSKYWSCLITHIKDLFIIYKHLRIFYALNIHKQDKLLL